MSRPVLLSSKLSAYGNRGSFDEQRNLHCSISRACAYGNFVKKSSAPNFGGSISRPRAYGNSDRRNSSIRNFVASPVRVWEPACHQGCHISLPPSISRACAYGNRCDEFRRHKLYNHLPRVRAYGNPNSFIYAILKTCCRPFKAPCVKCLTTHGMGKAPCLWGALSVDITCRMVLSYPPVESLSLMLPLRAASGPLCIPQRYPHGL